jgi:uncharacterized protein Yka (UPF0111/DUF47 family)
LSSSFYKELTKSKISENIIWYCDGCKKAVPGVRKVLQIVNNLKESQDSINQRLSKVEGRLDKMQMEQNSNLLNEIKVDQAIMDFKEREKRKNSAIVFSLPEADESFEDYENGDLENVKKMCELASVQQSINIIRLGKKSQVLGHDQGPLK